MDRITAEILCSLTDDFYACNAESFSRTRRSAWPGWERVLASAGIVGKDGGGQGLPALEEGLFGNAEWPLSVLDVACGNLRFASYLRERLDAEEQLEYFAVDNCEGLVPPEEELANALPYVRFQKVDLLQRLLHGADLVDAIEAPACQLVVCFGLAHHVPGFELRAALLDALVRCAKPGGYVAVSFWQFMDSYDFASGALEQHARALGVLGLDPARLDAGDYLLGWQGVPAQEKGGIRYCHSFSSQEIDELVCSVDSRATAVDRFCS
ncbi:MAG: class I SAM-dependent methyltransferase, partial [Eggerthellaceae bacterium]|nr:class I SAM-dependent methyltransferase [Eggerthellaceae bacterium]